MPTRKPVLLLVDDERAVLDALEAVLRPVFEACCRVESFVNPEDALTAVSEWKAAGRHVAVAIVDQRMPEMTGVAFLRHLRSATSADTSHPTVRARAIVLTGYAGLDAALEAKNVGEVRRFLTKPWDDAALLAATGEQLEAYLRSSEQDGWFEFREVTSAREVEEHLHFRHEVYRLQPKTAVFLPGGVRPLDVDAYDQLAHFLTLYAVGRDRSAAVGTLRVVRDVAGPAALILSELVADDLVLRRRLEANRPERLPLLTYLVDADAVRRLVAEIDAAGEKIAEPGRLTLDPNCRSSTGGRGQLPLAYFLIESAAAFFFFFFFFRHCLLTCIPQHVRFYRPLGFREAEGTKTQLQPHLGVQAACLHGVDVAVPPPMQTRLTAMASRIRRTGATCFCPTFPACIPDPYETGQFETTDLFCPIEARAMIARTQNPGPTIVDLSSPG